MLPLQSTYPPHTIPSSSTCQLQPQFYSSADGATALAESSSLSFVIKPIDTPQVSPELSQVGAASFSPIYPFIFLTVP